MSTRSLMERDEEENNVPGKLPEFGAIFMSNTATKRECFKRKIFGLPSSQAHFVKQVKAGMILFLFEFEKKKLYGVFQACSDGAMNIVPHAYKSSGKQFPAQVLFSTIWYCSSLSEHEFRGAIKDNYYAAYKFNFGLSKDQVHRLLWLFSSRRLKCQLPQRQLMRRSVTKPIGNSLIKARREDDDEYGSFMSERVENEHDVGNDIGPPISAENSGSSWGKIRRAADYGRFSETDRARNEQNVDYDHRLALLIEHPRSSLVEVSRAADDRRLAESDRIGSECNVDSDCGAVVSAEYCGNFWGDVRRAAVDSRFSISDRVGSGRIRDNDCEPVIWTQYIGNSLSRGRRVADVGRFASRDSAGNECDVDNDLGPVLSTDYPRDSMGKVRRVAGDDARFVTNESVRKEPNADSELEPVIMTKYLGDSGDKVRLVVADDCRFLNGDSIGNECNVQNDHRPVISTECSGACQHNVNPLVYSRKTSQETNDILVHDQLRPSSAFFRSVEPQIPISSYLSSHGDTVITSTDPCDPEIPRLQFRHSQSLGLNHDFNLARECAPPCNNSAGNFLSTSKTQSNVVQASPYYSSVGNLFPSFKIQSPPFHLESNSVSKCLDVTCGSGNNSSFPTPGHHKYSQSRGAIPLSRARYCENSAIGSSELEGYKGVPFSGSSVPPIPVLGSGNYLRENMGLQSYSASPSKNSSFVVDHCYRLASKDKFDRKLRWCEGSEAVIASAPPLSTQSKCHMQDCVCSLQSKSMYHDEHDSISHDFEYYQNIEGVHSNRLNSRRSVFSRLTLGPNKCLEENGSHMVDDEHDLDTSVDDIMEMLDQNHLHWVKRLSKSKPLIKQYGVVENFRIKKQISFHCQNGKNCSEMSPVKINANVAPTNEVNGNQGAEGTTLVDFKRRSEVRKIQDENKTKVCVANADSESSLRGQCKRRKLIKLNANATSSNDVNGNQMAEGTLSVGFKHQNEVQKIQDENKTEGCAENADSDGSLCGQRKRRKLIRPNFSSDGSSHDRGIIDSFSPNIQILSEESCIIKDNAESFEVSVRTQENEGKSSQNVGLQHVMGSLGCDGNTIDVARSSNCGGERNSESWMASLRNGGEERETHENHNKSSQNVGLLHVMGSLVCESNNILMQREVQIAEEKET